MPKKQFVPPTVEEVAEHFAQQFRKLWKENGREVQNEPAMYAIARSWARDMVLHYQRMAADCGVDENDWRWGRKGERKVTNWRIAATQWFNRNIDDGKLKGYRGSAHARITAAPTSAKIAGLEAALRVGRKP